MCSVCVCVCFCFPPLMSRQAEVHNNNNTHNGRGCARSVYHQLLLFYFRRLKKGRRAVLCKLLERRRVYIIMGVYIYMYMRV